MRASLGEEVTWCDVGSVTGQGRKNSGRVENPICKVTPTRSLHVVHLSLTKLLINNDTNALYGRVFSVVRYVGRLQVKCTPASLQLLQLLRPSCDLSSF